jgi:putative SOS response-associated peptidase YedK
MCNRYTLKTPPDLIAEHFDLDHLPELSPRYNIAPTQNVLAVREPQGQREAVLLRWGLVPSWADDLKIGRRLLNARAETAASKPAYRAAFRKRRCLLVADGYYEWKTVSGKKQPYYFHLRDHAVFAFAGLWEHWHHNNQDIESCALLTTEANELGRPIHDRMPVILDRQASTLWLDPDIDDPTALQELLQPYPAQKMRCEAANPVVNNPRHDAPDCLLPAG